MADVSPVGQPFNVDNEAEKVAVLAKAALWDNKAEERRIVGNSSTAALSCALAEYAPQELKDVLTAMGPKNHFYNNYPGAVRVDIDAHGNIAGVMFANYQGNVYANADKRWCEVLPKKE